MNLHMHQNQTVRVPYPPFPDSQMMAHDEAISNIADAILNVNEAVSRAVSSGLTVELVRSSRCHNGYGNWGDHVSLIVHEGRRQ